MWLRPRPCVQLFPISNEPLFLSPEEHVVSAFQQFECGFGFGSYGHYFLKVFFSSASFLTYFLCTLVSLIVFSKLYTVFNFSLDPTCGSSWINFFSLLFCWLCVMFSHGMMFKLDARSWCICRDSGFFHPSSEVYQALFWKAIHLLSPGLWSLTVVGTSCLHLCCLLLLPLHPPLVTWLMGQPRLQCSYQ